LKIYLSVPRGFCAGVDRAIHVVELALKKFGAPIYVKHQIVHNPHVVKSLENKGAVTVDGVDDIPSGSNVVFSAHGSPPTDFDKAKVRKLNVIDATCPLVTKVHNEAHKYTNQGRKILLIGHDGHQEVKGTMGQADITLVDDQGDPSLPDWDPASPVTVLTQTTLSVDDTDKTIEVINDRFSDVVVRNDLCYATTNRQHAVKELCGKVDLVLVIGSDNSSNCIRLREVAESNGVPAYLVNSPNEINNQWFSEARKIGITSGASTPESLVQSVITYLNPEEVIELAGAEENIKFNLPLELN
jgi:4-hydroxy-3-methylbut-2-enyl diphosphate reductase